MAASGFVYEPQQMLLRREAIQDRLPDIPLAHVISDTVDRLNLGAFLAGYDKDGPRNRRFPQP